MPSSSQHTWWAPDIITSFATLVHTCLLTISIVLFSWKKKPQKSKPVSPFEQDHRQFLRLLLGDPDVDEHVMILILPSETLPAAGVNSFRELLNSHSNRSDVASTGLHQGSIGVSTLPASDENERVSDGSSAANRAQPRTSKQRKLSMELDERIPQNDCGMSGIKCRKTVDPRADEDDRRGTRRWLKQRTSMKSRSDK